MRKLDFKTLLLYFLVIFYTFISIYIQITNSTSHYIKIINPLCWLFLSIYAIYLLINNNSSYKAKMDKTQTVLIITMFYLIIYYFLGMFFGYARSPYSHRVDMIILNIWSYVSIILFQEIVRSVLLPSSKLKWYYYFSIVLLFTLVELNFYNFSNHFIDLETGFEYICCIILPAFSRNILFTYLAIVGGFSCNLCYRIPIMLTSLIIPIFPDLEWFWISLVDLLLVMVVFIQINYIHEKKTSRISRRSIRKERLIKKIPLLTCVVLFVSFVAGVFYYVPIAIMSNSMAELIQRGDVVVIKKLSTEEKKNLEVNDIIAYQLNGSQIVHRIVKLKKISENEYIFTTKGDNNKKADLKTVSLEQINGKVLIRVPKIGYPAVLLNELFQKSVPEVEKGK